MTTLGWDKKATLKYLESRFGTLVQEYKGLNSTGTGYQEKLVRPFDLKSIGIEGPLCELQIMLIGKDKSLSKIGAIIFAFRLSRGSYNHDTEKVAKIANRSTQISKVLSNKYATIVFFGLNLLRVSDTFDKSHLDEVYDALIHDLALTVGVIKETSDPTDGMDLQSAMRFLAYIPKPSRLDGLGPDDTATNAHFSNEISYIQENKTLCTACGGRGKQGLLKRRCSVCSGNRTVNCLNDLGSEHGGG